MKPENLDENLKKVFQLNSFESLTGVNNKTRIELGGSLKGCERRDFSIKKALNVLKSNLENKSLWIRIIIWGQILNETLNNVVFKDVKPFFVYSKIEDDSLVAYYFFKEFDVKKIYKLVASSVNHELGYEPSINMTCLYFNLDIPFLANVYDDRGMDYVG